MNEITGIHHVTALCGPPANNLWYYARLLGLRLVKRTVNFDDPSSYHFYYGDRTGRPGTLVTFFPHPGFRPGVPGAREVATTHLAAPPGALGYWQRRLEGASVLLTRDAVAGRDALRFRDGDGTRLTISEVERADAGYEPPPGADVPPEQAIRGIAAVTIVVNDLAPTVDFLTGTLGFCRLDGDGARAWFALGDGAAGQRLEVIADSAAPKAVLGAGSVHHVAWRVPDDAARDRVRAAVEGKVTGLTETRDRNYFRSIYFREPGGVVFEIATDVPGFLVDEDEAALGQALKLPPQFEPRRDEIEASLPRLPALESLR
jgi:glyoxalase family protein